MAFGRLVLRATVGGLMVGHGLQKLRGSFGGPGLQGTEQMMAAIDLHPAKHQARAAGLTETIGGGLTAAGFLSPLGPAMVAGVMAVAVRKVHAKNGLWATEGGFEYNLTMAAACILLAGEGPGPVSVDGLLGKQRSGFGWALVAAALAFGSSAAVLAMSERFRPDQTGVASADEVPGADGSVPSTLASEPGGATGAE